MKSLKKFFTDKNFLTALLFLAFGGFYLIHAYNTIPAVDQTSKDGFGAGFMPRIYGFATLVVAAILLITSVLRILKESKEETEQKAAAMKIAPIDVLRMVIAFVCVVLFAYFLKDIGFVLCSIPLLFVLVLLLTPSRVIQDYKASGGKMILFYGKILLFAVVFTLALHYLFSKGLGLKMPMGVLKGILP